MSARDTRVTAHYVQNNECSFFFPTSVHQNNAGRGIEFDLRERMFWTRTIIKHHIEQEIAGNSGQQLTLTGFVICAAKRRKNRSPSPRTYGITL